MHGRLDCSNFTRAVLCGVAPTSRNDHTLVLNDSRLGEMDCPWAIIYLHPAAVAGHIQRNIDDDFATEQRRVENEALD